MRITLNTQDILESLVASLAEKYNVTTDELYIGIVNGEVTAIAAIGESIPDDVFDNDEPQNTEAQEAASAAPQEPKKTKRTRRTRAQIEAAEAAEKGTIVEEPKAEVKPEVETKVEEPKVETVAEVTEPVTVAEEALFAEPEPEAPGATANPFGETTATVTDADDLFGQTATETKPVVEQGEAGFVKPAVDDDTLNLFN